MPVIYGTRVLSGLDAARPDANGALVGIFYYATDTKALYLCDSATGWRVASANFGGDKAADGPFAASGGWYCAAPPTAQPNGADGSSGCIMFYPTATPTAMETLFDHRKTGGGRGFMIVQGLVVGDRCQLSYYADPTGWANLPATFAGALNQVHCVAWSLTGGNVRVSFDGAAVQTVALNLATYVLPLAGDPLAIGMQALGGSSQSSSKVIATRFYSTVVSDADLILLSNATVRNTCRLPTVTGAVVWDTNAARVPKSAVRFTEDTTATPLQAGITVGSDIPKSFF